jgi:tRNA(fMet)-specific endonuclease VapC
VIVEAFDILAFDVETARHHAVLLAHARRSGRPRGAHDLQIAATARATGRTLLATHRIAFDDLPDVRHRIAVSA